MLSKYIIVILGASLTLSGTMNYWQYNSLVEKSAKIDILSQTLENTKIENAKNLERTLRYQADVRRIEQESDKIQKKAFKDVSRVENILKRKAKIYKRLMNLDYKKSQRELQEITK